MSWKKWGMERKWAINKIYVFLFVNIKAKEIGFFDHNWGKRHSKLSSVDYCNTRYNRRIKLARRSTRNWDLEGGKESKKNKMWVHGWANSE
jgi:hypothetical protein